MIIGVKKVGEDVELREVESLELEEMQSLVGGFVECMELDIGVEDYPISVDMWLNEEGKLHKLDPNIALFNEDGIQDIVVGDVFFTCHDEYGKLVGLGKDACTILPSLLDILKARYEGDDKSYAVPLLAI